MSIFVASSERIATFFTPRVQWKLWKVHLNYPIDTYRDNSCTTSDRFVKPLDFRHFERFSGSTRVTGKHTKKQFLMEWMSQLYWVVASETHLVRTNPYGDGYEVISGHRRKEAAIHSNHRGCWYSCDRRKGFFWYWCGKTGDYDTSRVYTQRKKQICGKCSMCLLFSLPAYDKTSFSEVVLCSCISHIAGVYKQGTF